MENPLVASRRCGLVVLVLDLAHDLFEDVFERADPQDRALAVPHHRQVTTTPVFARGTQNVGALAC